MFITFHLFSSITLGVLLIKLGYLDSQYLIYGILGGVLLDLDVLLDVMHRNLIFHTPLFWIGFMIIGLNYQPIFIFSTFALIHVLFDAIDWGIMLVYPFSRRKLGLKILNVKVKEEKKN
ncbi:MAG: hypothetical protein ACE5KE_13270 [Methanosarcinales archaeon]